MRSDSDDERREAAGGAARADRADRADASDNDYAARMSLSRVASVGVIVIAVLITIAALNLAAVAALPLVASLLLAVLLWPVQKRLSRIMPRFAAATVCAVLMLAVVGVIIGWAWYATDATLEQFSENRESYVEQYQSARDWLVGLGVPADTVPAVNGSEEASGGGGDNGADASTNDEPSNGGDAASNGAEDNASADGESQSAPSEDAIAGASPSPVVGGGPGVPGAGLRLFPGEEGDAREALFNQETRVRLTRLIAGGLQSAAGILAAIGLTVFLTLLALYEGERWKSWWHDRLPESNYQDIHELAVKWSRQARWYFIGKSATGVISGGATWLWLMMMGVPLAALWGVFTFFMNFIPNVGALISATPPTLLAIVELGWAKGLLVGAGLAAIEMLVGNLLDPLFQGRMLKLSSWAVLASLVFWAWMWGIAGAIMAPVLTAAILVAVLRFFSGDARTAAREPAEA
jgi:predicted PurR-regulated permease PerM